MKHLRNRNCNINTMDAKQSQLPRADSQGTQNIQVKELLPEPYYIEDGLRRVRPYNFTYNTYCKERWRNKTLLDIFGSEFRDRPVDYYVRTWFLWF